jgi:hypothetical protein
MVVEGEDPWQLDVSPLQIGIRPILRVTQPVSPQVVRLAGDVPTGVYARLDGDS